MSTCTLCERFASILRGTVTPAPDGVCFVTRMREDISESILGRRTVSPVVFLMAFSFEDLDSSGRALCLGEFVFRESEVEPFLDEITNQGIRVAAVHNHWNFESPRLIYIHWEAIMEPLRFARISARAIDRAIGIN